MRISSSFVMRDLSLEGSFGVWCVLVVYGRRGSRQITLMG
jgi:hypothetical protein